MPGRHEGRILAAQEAPPSPVFLRNGHERSAPVPVAPSGTNGLGERWTAALQPLDSRAAEEKDQGDNTDSAAAASKPEAASPASRRSSRGRDGRQFRKPCAKGCRLERSSGNWESTGPPSRNTSPPRALQRDNPGPVPLRHHLITWQPDRVTFLPAA